jgi:hypothetical protein
MSSLSTDPKRIRVFGLVAFAVFGALTGLSIWNKRPVAPFVFGPLCVIGLCLLASPRRFRPLYTAWLTVAHLIGTFFTAVLLAVAYLAVITPAGLLKRVVSGPPLPLEPDRTAPTYWVERPEPAQPRERFLKRF